MDSLFEGNFLALFAVGLLPLLVAWMCFREWGSFSSVAWVVVGATAIWLRGVGGRDWPETFERLAILIAINTVAALAGAGLASVFPSRRNERVRTEDVRDAIRSVASSLEVEIHRKSTKERSKPGVN